MDHATTAASHNMMVMLVHDDVNECPKMHQGFHHDVEPFNVRKASEESQDHLDIITDNKTHLQTQDPHIWYHGAWARLCPSLQPQSQRTQLRAGHIYTLII